MDIQSYFDSNYYSLDEKAIYSLNEIDSGQLHNVIVHLNDYCYGVIIENDNYPYKYLIFYVENKNDLCGRVLKLSLELNFEERNLITIEFCKILNDEFSGVDIVDSFNTFQTHLRTGFEKLGFFTVGSETMGILNKDSNCAVFPHSKKGVLCFPIMNKLDLYRWYFDEDGESININEDRIKKVYLILDSTNNLIKIGQSFYPRVREKTLQGVSPDWDIITTWIAPVAEEKYLHTLFQEKRTRGEWFKLGFSDLKIIKEYMSKYKN
ncbi:GIY-YIG nuclease family protein [Marinifilum fragile]|uniref:GIY-YIG nuclease family protein n=1 Tax=Marinifilum fragile TaxID=570161 RepID=UPI002AABF564|nr:GIY-YIG nuclease family protein [Marinifilum fragile]